MRGRNVGGIEGEKDKNNFIYVCWKKKKFRKLCWLVHSLQSLKSECFPEQESVNEEFVNLFITKQHFTKQYSCENFRLDGNT